MRTFTLVSALAAIALAAPAVRQSCTADGGKCAGAAGFPLVPYAPCCSSTLVCAPRGSPPAGTWGSFCIPAAEAAATTTTASTSAPANTTAAGPSATGRPAPTGPAAGGNSTAAPRTTVVGAGPGSNATAAPAPTSAPVATGAPMPVATSAPNATGATKAPMTNATMTPNVTVSPTATIAPNVTTAPNATVLPNVTIIPNATTSNGSKCFPSFATVELEDGSLISMDKVSIGDIVKVGANAFSKVFMFTHKTQDGTHEFVELTTSSGASVALTSGHYIPVDGALVAAGDVTVGSELQLGSGAMDTVVAIRSIVGTGLYNPQTIEGNVVVNGVVASTYTTAVEPRFAHAILAPFRSLSTVFGLDLTFLESGGGLLADIAPRGQSVF